MRKLLYLLMENNIQINTNKCNWLKTEVEYLGFHLDKDGIRPIYRNLEVIRNLKRPENVKEVQS